MLFIIEENGNETQMANEYANGFKLKGDILFLQKKYAESIRATNMGRLINEKKRLNPY